MFRFAQRRLRRRTVVSFTTALSLLLFRRKMEASRRQNKLRARLGAYAFESLVKQKRLLAKARSLLACPKGFGLACGLDHMFRFAQRRL
jgi:hypothetical protein